MKRLDCFCPSETAAKLLCPERGFYTIIRYTADEVFRFPEGFLTDPGDTLFLVEINLKNYSSGSLSERALNGIDELFNRLRKTGRGLIIRFLYDWNGRNIITEPKSVDIITEHIAQLGGIIVKNADIIFLLQGLFVGNWGEMHGSRFIRSDILKKLYAQLLRSTENRVKTAVRTPALWRTVAGMRAFPENNTKIPFPGLFNDGMLGSDSDYGTYSGDPEVRDAELRLQKQLCGYVPYGGEVVGDTQRSDPERAMAALEEAGVSYLNRMYDEKTLSKWKDAFIKDKSIWNGMSYFDYAEARLGYRFVVRGVKLRLSPFSGDLSAAVSIENVGFAPICHDTEARLIFKGKGSQAAFTLNGNLNGLFREQGCASLTLKAVSPEGLRGGGEYEIYFRLKSLKYNVTIPTANQGGGEYGILIGRYTG